MRFSSLKTGLVGALFCLAGQASAGPQTDELGCAAIDDDAARLACYDKQAVRAEPKAASEPEVRTIAQDPAPEPVAKTVAATDTDEVAAPESEQKKSKKKEEFVAIVASVERLPHGEHRVVLEDGQVWVEQQASRYFPVEQGDEVTLRERRFGGYLLIAPTGKSFSVREL